MDWLLNVWPSAFITAWPCALVLGLTLIPRVAKVSLWLARITDVQKPKKTVNMSLYNVSYQLNKKPGI